MAPARGPVPGRRQQPSGRIPGPGLGPHGGRRTRPPGRGRAGKSPQLLTSDGVCDSADPAVLARLRELHPKAEGPGLAAPLPDDRPDVTTPWASDQLLEMEAVVWSFPPGSAAGPSGLRPQHLLDCLNSADSAAKAGLLEALLTLVTAVSAGRRHPQAAPLLCTARLIPLRKEDGVVRPIAVGDTLRRLGRSGYWQHPRGGVQPPPLPCCKPPSQKAVPAKWWRW